MDPNYWWTLAWPRLPCQVLSFFAKNESMESLFIRGKCNSVERRDRLRNASMTTASASWSQRHRLGQTAQEARTGVFSAHHTAEVVHLRGPLRIDALASAWRRLQVRHPVLLSAFGHNHTDWLLNAAGPAELVLLSPAASVRDTVARVQSSCNEPFDLANGPLGRLMVLPVSSAEAYVALAVEHLVSDAWSLNVLQRDLAALYAQETGRSGTVLPPIRKTFPQVVQEQYEYLASPEGEKTLRAHAERIRPVGPIPAMPIMGFTERQNIRYDRTSALQYQLSGQLRGRLGVVGRPFGLGPLNLMHAALHTALYQLSGRVTVASTLSTANRESRSVSETVGWLSSKTVLMSSPGRFGDAADYLRHFSSQMLVTLDESHLPWPSVIAVTAPELVGRHSPLPYVTFNATPVSIGRDFATFNLPGMSSSPVTISGGWHDPSIATFWTESDEGVAVRLQYKLDWYARADIDRLWKAISGILSLWSALAD